MGRAKVLGPAAGSACVGMGCAKVLGRAAGFGCAGLARLAWGRAGPACAQLLGRGCDIDLDCDGDVDTSMTSSMTSETLGSFCFCKCLCNITAFIRFPIASESGGIVPNSSLS